MAYCPYIAHKNTFVEVQLTDDKIVRGVFEDVGSSAFNLRDWWFAEDGSTNANTTEPITINKNIGFLRIIPLR